MKKIIPPLAKDESLVKEKPLHLDDMLAAAGVHVEALDDGMDFEQAKQNALKKIDLTAVQDDLPDDGTPTLICPHCWHRFKKARIYSISRHPSLVGDTVLGADAQIRFLATRFTADGSALDACGMVCPDLACPRCHLQIPESLMTMPYSLVSIVGSPSSGKSYFLTAMLFRLKSILMQFNYALSEADASMDMVLSRYEQLLFYNTSNNTYVALPKTELQGSDFSSQVHLDGIDLQLPLPFVYTLKPLASGVGTPPAKNLVLYDNAGEHFEPGRDSVTNPATQHLVNSECIMFLFDPFKDSRSIDDCSKLDPQGGDFRQTANQVQILNEMIARIKKSPERARQAQGKYPAPLIVVIPKFDAWKGSFPINEMDNDGYVGTNPANGFQALDITNVRMVSYAARQWLLRRIPELPSVAEAFFENVYYIPVSALGRGPEYDRERNILGVRPDHLNPLWCEVPMLIYLWHSGHVAGILQPFPDARPADEYCTFRNGVLFFQPPNARFPQGIPDMFQGMDVYDEQLGLIRLPRCPEEERPSTQAASASADGDDFWNS